MSDGKIAVNLERDWFSPDGSLYQVRDNPHEFPEEWADEPSKEQKEGNPDVKYAVLPSTAEVLEDAKTVAVVQKTAGGQEAIIPQIVDDKTKSVGGALDASGNEKANQSVASAEKGAEAAEVQVGGKPRESGPLPAGTKK